MSFKHHVDAGPDFTVPSVSVAGLPTIDFEFRGDTCRAKMEGAALYAKMRRDGNCDLRLKDAGGEVLADLVVNERSHRTMTENVIDIGSALLWSHWRYLEASRHVAEEE